MSLIPPNGFDRADGIDGNAGTATPNGTVIQSPIGFFLEEASFSPEIEFGEQATVVHTFYCDPDTAQIILLSNARGTVLIDNSGNYSRVLSTKLNYNKGLYCTVVVTAEGTFIVPPDEFSVEAIEFNPSLYRHPRYIDVLNYKGMSTTGQSVTGAQIINLIQGASNFPQVGAQTDATNSINSSLITNNTVLAEALEELSKIQQGFDTFYLAGFRVTYSTYFYQAFQINPGGYIEDPVESGNLPAYFWSDDGTPSGQNIFSALAATVSPVLYGQGLSWLRQSDTQSFQRTWFKITSTWIGGPFGQWDEEIYNPNAAPPALPTPP